MHIDMEDGLMTLKANHLTEVVQVSTEKVVWEEACGHQSETTVFPFKFEGWRFGNITANPPIPEASEKQNGTIKVRKGRIVVKISGVKYVIS